MAAPETLLATKLGVQVRRTRYVARERLRGLLEAADEVRLILVSAPAGFGKTTLLADWLATTRSRSAWLSLDPGDNDVVRFSRYLLAATADLAARPDYEARIDGARRFDPEFTLRGIVDAIAAASECSREGGSVVVLDDYHLIEEPAIHGLVASLVERLPRRARLVIATRADPPLPLARLRARDELLEVRAADLRFPSAEAASLLQSTGAELALGEVEALTDRTEGWAAAHRLAGASLRGRPNHEELVQRFGASNRYVLDYIVEEVLAGLSPDTQRFLLRTSILERLSGPLCEAVTGDPEGQARLEELERANLLIVPLDDERRWYRYHALFAEILRARLTAAHPDDVAGLHASASAWHEEHGNDDEAIVHALRSGDVERMSRVVAIASGRYINAGELATMRHWLDALPQEIVRNHAQLAASYAWYLVTVGETEGVAEWLADAERALATGNDGGPAMRAGLPTQLAMLRSELASAEGDTSTAIEQARLAGRLVPEGLPPTHRAILRGMATVLEALALNRAGDLDAAAKAYEEAMPDLRAGGNVLALGRSIADLAGIAIRQGDAERALRLCESEMALRDAGTSAAGNASVWAAMARAHAVLGHDERAEAAARRTIEVGTRTGDAPSVSSAEKTLELLAQRRPAAATARPNTGGLVEPLSGREIEVLRLVALGRSNSRIAVELFVTVGTVKSHLHTISGKLGAANRVEAVARGRELGLLD